MIARAFGQGCLDEIGYRNLELNKKELQELFSRFEVGLKNPGPVVGPDTTTPSLFAAKDVESERRKNKYWGVGQSHLCRQSGHIVDQYSAHVQQQQGH